jgi:hypothetical protein
MLLSNPYIWVISHEKQGRTEFKSQPVTILVTAGAYKKSLQRMPQASNFKRGGISRQAY